MHTFFCLSFFSAEIRIGFAREVYSYYEPEVQMLFTNLTIVKDGGRISEQIFRVNISISDPATVAPATLRTSPVQEDWDFAVGFAGQTSVLRDFFSSSQSVLVAFFLNGDDSVEDVEGFMLTSSPVVTDGFPSFLSPLPTSTTAFQSTTVQIFDCKCITYPSLWYLLMKFLIPRPGHTLHM